MDLDHKLDILAPAARFDACDSFSQGGRRYRPKRAAWSDAGIIDEVGRAARMADRLSLNLEAPSAEHLARISPERDWAGDLIARLAWARDWQREGLLPSGLATQFVVGAAGESDRDLLLTTTWLYR